MKGFMKEIKEKTLISEIKKDLMQKEITVEKLNIYISLDICSRTKQIETESMMIDIAIDGGNKIEIREKRNKNNKQIRIFFKDSFFIKENGRDYEQSYNSKEQKILFLSLDMFEKIEKEGKYNLERKLFLTETKKEIKRQNLKQKFE